MAESGEMRFAFCYPFSLDDTETMLQALQRKSTPPPDASQDAEGQPLQPGAIYFHREVACLSLEQRPVVLITLSSYKGWERRREARLPLLFPDAAETGRAHAFGSKPVRYLCPFAPRWHLFAACVSPACQELRTRFDRVPCVSPL